MKRAIRMLAGLVWLGYAVGAVSQSSSFWATASGINLPQLSMPALDVVYYVISTLLSPYYLRKGWLCFRGLAAT